ncbi:hypothetical protein LCGC14_2609230 [marine sediment metagenome]|uniref:N-acetyltransferase domain-containing protein n=1 Tax=marine sediment metagenome TaxID=412755 RepID=A0A0F9A6L8_9ZZZZ|nr:GNAT family N-acetyltransferase [bacterium]
MFGRSISDTQIAYQVANLVNENNRLHTKYSYAQILEKRQTYLVETIGNLVVGCAAIEKQGYTISELKHISVNVQFRRKGIAKTMVEAALARAKTPIVYATVQESNVSSQKLLASCGFTSTNKYMTGKRQVLLFVTVAPKWANLDIKNILDNIISKNYTIA